MGQFGEVLDKLLDRFSKPSPITVAALIACAAVLNIEALGRLFNFDFGQGVPKDSRWMLWLVVIYTGAVMTIAALRLTVSGVANLGRWVRWHPKVNPYSVGEKTLLGDWIFGTQIVNSYQLEQAYNLVLREPIQVHTAIERLIRRGYLNRGSNGGIRMTASGIQAVSDFVRPE